MLELKGENRIQDTEKGERTHKEQGPFVLAVGPPTWCAWKRAKPKRPSDAIIGGAGNVIAKKKKKKDFVIRKGRTLQEPQMMTGKHTPHAKKTRVASNKKKLRKH